MLRTSFSSNVKPGLAKAIGAACLPALLYGLGEHYQYLPFNGHFAVKITRSDLLGVLGSNKCGRALNQVSQEHAILPAPARHPSTTRGVDSSRLLLHSRHKCTRERSWALSATRHSRVGSQEALAYNCGWGRCFSYPRDELWRKSIHNDRCDFQVLVGLHLAVRA